MKPQINAVYQLLYFSVSGTILCLAFIALIGLRSAPAVSLEQDDNLANSSVSHAEPDHLAAGKTLFMQNCAQCHAKDMTTRLTGPALAGVSRRWAEYPRADLYAWIRNSQSLISAGHPRAEKLWQEWDQAMMNNNLHLTDGDIDAILEYVER